MRYFWIVALASVWVGDCASNQPTIESVVTAEGLQHQDEALMLFLDLLHKDVPSTPSSEIGESVFESAYSEYLSLSSLPPPQQGKTILDNYQSILKMNPEYHSLRFLIANAHANVHDFTAFYREFYKAYKHLPHHFLVDKTKGALFLRLSERMRTVEKRKVYQVKALHCLLAALEKRPSEQGLYARINHVARLAGEPGAVVRCLKIAMQHDIKLPSKEIAHYTSEALKANEQELAERLVEKAESWYEFSRAVTAARNLVERNKNG